MHTLLNYIDRTKDLRMSEKLFVSFVITFHTSSKAHSYRGATASTALSQGDVLRTADWALAKNFQKFYFGMVENVGGKSYIWESHGFTENNGPLILNGG